ncbi:ubiquitin-protein ligase molybdopterin-converting factor [Durotheca rogersii]|uniref:ubiquitin-protein ligase molybdopterin-converting factor n=1 Tax=Durotheca rogersii TaxID=419775 RepID=UPI00221FF287|nr:ubiquitin-protein ligase molybdopterin-converting factor [Durotheca rogersii]KAI5867478.1 ubiquitin-protein ligase molybdopterin-converting factor [Durotheca rogersii]
MAASASFLERAVSNSQVQLAATAIASGAVVAGLILGSQRLQREERLHRLKDSIPSLLDESDEALRRLSSFDASASAAAEADREDARNELLARRARAGDYDEELILEQLARNRVFLTPAGLDRLRAAFVVVVGCGGVGSHCAAALARSGVSRLRLVDFDQVSLSSLNRHAVATLADVGTPKVRCLERRLAAVAPWVRFDLRQEKFWDEAAGQLLAPWEGEQRPPDFVVDAIDNIDTKVALLKYCHDHHLPVISSMGAGCKSDPTRIIVGDIGTSTDDGLSRSTRRRLKLLGITKGIPTVYSTEKTGEGKAELLPLPEDEFQKGQVGDLGVLPDFRVRILPVLGTMPAVFGYTAANHIILSITGYPHDYVPAKGREKMYEGLLAAVQGSEERLVRHATGGDPAVTLGLKIPLTAADTAFLVEEVFKGRSAVTALPTRLTLLRWRRPASSILVRVGEGAHEQKSTSLRLADLVCLTKEEAVRHDQEVLRGDKTPEDLYDEATVKKVEALLRDSARYEKYR